MYGLVVMGVMARCKSREDEERMSDDSYQRYKSESEPPQRSPKGTRERNDRGGDQRAE